MTTFRLMKPAAISALILAVPLGAAQAYETQAVLDRLKTVMSEQGLQLEWSGFSDDGSSITLNGVEAGPPGEALEVGTVRLDDITELGDGGYRIGTVGLPSFSETEDGATVVADGLSITGLRLPAAAGDGPYSGMLLYEAADMQSMTVALGDDQVFAMNQLHFELDVPDDASRPMSFSGAAESISADLTKVDDAEARAVLAELGYGEVAGYFEMNGSWSPSDGNLSLAQFDFAVEEVGTIGFSLDLGGYTTQFLDAVREMQKNMAANQGGDNSQQGLAMLGLMQQLSFVGASIDYADDSLTGRILEFVAKQQGTTPEQIANQAKAVVPFAMAQLNDPDLTAAVTQAVTKFLDDPQNITVTAAPAAPVPFAVIMAGAMSAPQALPKQLGVTVTANE